MNGADKYRLCFIGPMIGRRPGYITTPGQILSDLFKNAGYPVLSASAFLNRYMRLADILRVLLREHRRIDILILDTYSGPSFVVADIVSQLSRYFNLPLIMYLHGGSIPEFMESFPRWSKRVLKRADILLAPSKFLARAVEPYGFKARIIPNVIDLSAYPYRRRHNLRPRLFWMRSFHPVYNPEMALRVLARLKLKFPGASLVMAGQDKGLLAGMKRLAKELDVEECVQFPGFLDMAGKIRKGERADIFINTNRVDNMPVAVLEACAMGLPVVSTNVGGVPDLLTDSETGLLIPSEDAEAMAQAIERLIAEPVLAGRISVKARKLAEQSSWDQIRPQWEDLFSSAIKMVRR